MKPIMNIIVSNVPRFSYNSCRNSLIKLKEIFKDKYDVIITRKDEVYIKSEGPCMHVYIDENTDFEKFFKDANKFAEENKDDSE